MSALGGRKPEFGGLDKEGRSLHEKISFVGKPVKAADQTRLDPGSLDLDHDIGIIVDLFVETLYAEFQRQFPEGRVVDITPYYGDLSAFQAKYRVRRDPPGHVKDSPVGDHGLPCEIVLPGTGGTPGYGRHKIYFALFQPFEIIREGPVNPADVPVVLLRHGVEKICIYTLHNTTFTKDQRLVLVYTYGDLLGGNSGCGRNRQRYADNDERDQKASYAHRRSPSPQTDLTVWNHRDHFINSTRQ